MLFEIKSGAKSCIKCGARFDCPYVDRLGLTLDEKEKAKRIGSVCPDFEVDNRINFISGMRVCDLKG